MNESLLRKKEIRLAYNTPAEERTERQRVIMSIYHLLVSEENTGKMAHMILEAQLIKYMKMRKRGLISPSDYRQRVSAIELFYFN